MPNILVSNDDGITAKGIAALVEVAKEFGTVTVVAPDSPQSAQSNSITLYQPLRLKSSNVFTGIEAYACDGTPTDCVKLAKNIIFKENEIDFCLSGINHGSNASINIIYSGTMSAAMEASIDGIPSIGFSLEDYDADANFDPSQQIVRKILTSIILGKEKPPALLNVNIPKLPIHEIKGVKVCQQGSGQWVEDYQMSEDPRGGKYYWLAGKFVNKDHASINSDLNALANGYVSVVPSSHDLTVYQEIKSLSHLNSK